MDEINEHENEDHQANVTTPPSVAPVELGPAPTLGVRGIAAVIDVVVGAVLYVIPLIGWLVSAAYWLARDGLDIGFMNHRSIGKQLMNLEPVTTDGTPLDLAASVKRNWVFGIGAVIHVALWVPILGLLVAIPLALAGFALGLAELFFLLTDAEGRRLGDKMAKTRVVVKA